MDIPVIGKNSRSLQFEEPRTRTTLRSQSRFTEVLKEGAQVLLAGAEVATSFVGGPVLSAAIGRARQALSGGPLSTMSSKDNMQALRDLQEQTADMNMFFLELQQRMQAESRKFTTISNILKARHDTARNAINNIRS